MNTKTIALALACVFAPGCSTMVNGTNQAVQFDAVDASGAPADGADCTVTGGSNFDVDKSFTTPAELKVPRSKKPLEVVCSRAGLVGTQTGTEVAKGKFEGTYLGNLIIGGVPGFVIDAVTGAIHKYPDTITVTLDSMTDRMEDVASEPVAN